MAEWKSVAATWRSLHRTFEQKTAIQDYLVKKKKLKFFKVKKSGAKQIARCLSAVDQCIIVYDIAGAEKASSNSKNLPWPRFACWSPT